MLSSVFQKIHKIVTYKPIALPLLIFGIGFLAIIMVAGKKEAAVQEPKKNKLLGLGTEIYYYFWKNSRPVEVPKLNYFQRLWNYFN